MASNPQDRLIQTIGMMGAEAATEGDNTANAAFLAATRMLKQQGLTWRDIAERALGAEPRLQPLGEAGVAKAQGFSDIFDGMFAETFGAGFGRGAASPPPRAAPKAPSRLHGVDVPETIRGIVRVVDAERHAKTGPMLVVEIVGSQTIYGPLMCFSASVIEELYKSIDQGIEVMAKIQKPRSDTQSPVIVSANVVGG